MNERLSENLMGERDRLIDERDKLQAENAKLKAQVERLRGACKSALDEMQDKSPGVAFKSESILEAALEPKEAR